MLDKETIKMLRLIPELGVDRPLELDAIYPEIDITRAQQIKFHNSDMSAIALDLGRNSETMATAFFAAKVAAEIYIANEKH